MEMTRKELRATRKELSTLKKEWTQFTAVANKTGKAAAKGFGKSFKTAAKFTLKEFARGALNAVGQRWVESLGRKGTKGGRAFGKRAKQAAKQEMNASGGIASGIKLNMGAMAVIGAAGLAAAAVAQFKNGLDSAIEGERLEISFNALSPDGAGGSRIFEKLRKEALRTGVEISDMASSIQRFMALGFAESDALQLNKSLLDIAGSLGMTNSEAALLGSALAQVKAKGVASMEELRQQIAEKGVPVFQMLAEKMGVTEAEIIKMVSAGKIGADTVIEAFQNLEGPLSRFRGGSDRMGKSAGGLFSRIKQHAIDLKRIFVTGFLPDLKPFLEDQIGFIERLKTGAEEWGKKMGDVIGNIRAMFTALSLGEILELAALKLKKGLLNALDLAARGAAALMEAMQDDSFERMLKRAALTFKETLLGAISEALLAMGEGAGGVLGARLETAGNLAGIQSAKAKGELLEHGRNSEGQKSFAEALRENFKKQGRIVPGLSKGDLEFEKGYEDLIRKQNEANRAARKAAEEDSAPAAAGSTSTTQKNSVSNPAGPLGSGLANAISRITGGGTIVMDKQLAAMEGTRKAAEKTAEATATLVKNTKPPRGGKNSVKAGLVLG
jgi:tape measure domain-containing protein